MISTSSYQQRLVKGVCPLCGESRDSSLLLCSECGQKKNAYNREYRLKRISEGNPLKVYNPVKHKKYSRNIKLETLKAYGGIICKCCGEDNVQFLTLDHVNNDGKHNRNPKSSLAWSYSSLRAKGFPNNPPLQVLCYNCNNGKRVNNGVCPHQDIPLK